MMKRLFSTVRSRLRESGGFMLAEQLMAVCLLGFLSLAIASGLGVCLTVQSNVTREANAQSVLSRTISTVSDQLAFSREPNADDGSFVSSTTEETSTLTSDDAGIRMNGTVLVGVSHGITPAFAEGGTPAYDPATDTWTYTVTVSDSRGRAKTQTMTVRRVTP